MVLLCGGRLHIAPLVHPKTILDIGTGTGIWAMEMADQYPESMIIGTDLSPVQPTWYETDFHVRLWAAKPEHYLLRVLGYRTTLDSRLTMSRAKNGHGEKTNLITYIQDT